MIAKNDFASRNFAVVGIPEQLAGRAYNIICREGSFSYVEENENLAQEAALLYLRIKPKADEECWNAKQWSAYFGTAVFNMCKDAGRKSQENRAKKQHGTYANMSAVVWENEDEISNNQLGAPDDLSPDIALAVLRTRLTPEDMPLFDKLQSPAGQKALEASLKIKCRRGPFRLRQTSLERVDEIVGQEGFSLKLLDLILTKEETDKIMHKQWILVKIERYCSAKKEAVDIASVAHFRELALGMMSNSLPKDFESFPHLLQLWYNTEAGRYNNAVHEIKDTGQKVTSEQMQVICNEIDILPYAIEDDLTFPIGMTELLDAQPDE